MSKRTVLYLWYLRDRTGGTTGSNTAHLDRVDVDCGHGDDCLVR